VCQPGQATPRPGRAPRTDGSRAAASTTVPGPSARVEAFLTVPLYKKIYDEFSDSLLPDDIGLEARLQRFGVTRNETSRARQVFARSAEQAGLFDAGSRDRLIKPSVDRVDEPAERSRLLSRSGTA
jgi:hypothetical protein